MQSPSLRYDLELDQQPMLVDTRTWKAKLRAAVQDPAIAGLSLLAPAVGCFFVPRYAEYFVLGFIGAVAYIRSAQKKAGLTHRMPKSSKLLDPKEPDPAKGRPTPAEGIIYLGNDMDTGEEIWMTDSQARTHMLFMGTTGSGKSQPLHSKVLTPAGWISMGEVKAGTVVSTPSGQNARVLEVFPQGNKLTRGVFLQNGRHTYASNDHLWLARIDGEQRIVTTGDAESAFRAAKQVLFPYMDSDGTMSWSLVQRFSVTVEEPHQCILLDDVEHLYITDDQIVTHNTEFLLSDVFNALIHGSGFVYVDGKADNSLYGKIYSMARAMGREDDVVVINFQTGAKDIYGAQPNKLSNTMNPFAIGSSGMISELVKGLMSSEKKDIWSERASSFVEALIKPLVYLRDKHGLELDVGVVRSYFAIATLEELAFRPAPAYKGILESGVLDGLQAYLKSLAGYKIEKYQDQADTVYEQHGYIEMQLTRAFGSLSDTYGYIMKTPLGEIDFEDVFLNRRILVVLLPALEKSPAELTNLGRIVVASLKATMAKGLGSSIEGDWSDVIDARPNRAPSPFPCVLDEYGYYAVEGFAVVPAQARSLGFSAIFAGQDLPAFEKASKEEAASTLANTNTKLCGKLECTKTFEYFKGLAGQGYYTRIRSFEQDFGATLTTVKLDEGVSIDRIDRVSATDLRGQRSGEWYMFFANAIIRVKSFFANPKRVKKLRVNHFLKVSRPGNQEVEAYRASTENFLRAVRHEGGITAFMDRVSSPSDILDIMAGMQQFKADPPILRAGKVLAFCSQAEARRLKAFTDLSVDAYADAEIPSDELFGAPAEQTAAPVDFLAHAYGEPPEEPAAFTAPQEPVDSGSLYSEDRNDEIIPASAPSYQEFDMGGVEDMPQPADLFGREPNETSSNVFGLLGDTPAETPPEELQNAHEEHVREGDLGPISMDQEEPLEDAKFDEPKAAEGMLDREATESGLSAIERQLGADESDAALTGSIVAGKLAEATQYLNHPEPKRVAVEELEAVVKRLHQLITEQDQAE